MVSECVESCPQCGRYTNAPDSINGKEVAIRAISVIRSLPRPKEQIEELVRRLQWVHTQADLDEFHASAASDLNALTPKSVQNLGLWIAVLMAVLLMLKDKKAEELDLSEVLRLVNNSSSPNWVAPVESPRLRRRANSAEAKLTEAKPSVCKRHETVLRRFSIQIGDLEAVVSFASEESEYWTVCRELSLHLEDSGAASRLSELKSVPRYQKYLKYVGENGSNILAWSIIFGYLARLCRNSLRRVRETASKVLDQLILKE